MEAPAPADVPNEPANQNQAEAAEENVERDSADLPIPINLEPALPSAKDKPLRMYSDEDIKAIIKAAMQEFTESTRIASKQSTHENHLEFTGSEITSEAMDNLLDLQSIIEIDINDTPDMVILESRRVPVKEYTITTTHQSTQAGKINFTNDGNNNRMKLRELELILNDCELYSLAEETRVPVKSSESNPDGYTHESAKIDGKKIIITKKDDYFKINADCIRLFAIMNLATNKDLHYLLTTQIKDKNGVEWYKVVKTFALGERSNESGLSRKLLDELKLPSSKTVKENIAAFEEAVLRVDNVNLTSMTENEKLFIIIKKFTENKQEGIQAIIYTCKATKKTYRELLEMLILADPPVIKSQKLNALTDDSNICRNFLNGNCTYGDRCKYSHKPQAPPGTKPTDKKQGDKGDRFKGKYRPPDIKKVTSEKRARVGDPRGKPSPKNPHGYSLKQLEVLRTPPETEYVDHWQNPHTSMLTRARPQQHT